MQRITTFITFESRGKEAVEYYVSVFKNAHVDTITVYPETGALLHAAFTLDGQQFMAMDGGEHFKFEDGVSLFVTCDTQEEVDYFWEKLSANGGNPGQCGWLKDKFGMSWQVVPRQLGELMSDGDPAASQRVMQAMLGMHKINIAELQAAHDHDQN